MSDMAYPVAAARGRTTQPPGSTETPAAKQYALPVSDVTITNWIQLAGNSNGQAFDELDEGFGAGRGDGAGPDDGTTVWQSDATNSAERLIECALGELADPGVSTGHIIRARVAKNSDGGAAVTCVLSLYQGETLIASSPASDALALAYSTIEYTLTGTEADAITDYTALRLRATYTIGGGTNRRARISTMEMEIPGA